MVFSAGAGSVTATPREHRISAQDGRRLYVRDYDAGHDHGAVLCLPGLTRNSKDFDPIARHLAERHRVVCLDLRGRGQSEWDPSGESYRPDVYVSDVLSVLAALGIHRVAVIGTSLGGIVAMGIAVARPSTLAGVTLNDIGPELAREGIQRIASYVGQPAIFDTWDSAVDAYRQRYAVAYPDLPGEAWPLHARNAMTERQGRIVFDYDPGIATALRGAGPPQDLWPQFRAMAHLPVMVLRGGLSDLLSQETCVKMAAAMPAMEVVEIPRVGHVPLLDEPIAVRAIDAFLAKVFPHG
ncbi:MAG: alpha/beta hydrolase [Alphaproteobacteria bacterium]|nr:alpha/beta hydrolase [Alphaproteobacteria bacterium]